MYRLFARHLPASLISRVMLYYGVTLFVFLAATVAALTAHESEQEIDTSQQQAVMMIEVLAQTVADSAVIGDYDTIKRSLDKAVIRSEFSKAQFIDLGGGSIQSTVVPDPSRSSPDFLKNWLAKQLHDVNKNIIVGGRDYGVLRLTFDGAGVSDSLWEVIKTGLLIAVLSLLGGLLMVWLPLKGWLRSLERSSELVSDASLILDPEIQHQLIESAPLEFRQTLRSLEKTALQLHGELSERERALQSLRQLVADLLPPATGETVKEVDINALISTVTMLVNERQQAALLLEVARERADSTSRAKSAFLANMSHEIRTPMNGILGMTQLLQSAGVSEQERIHYAGIILNSGKTLLNILNDVLDLSKIEAGKLHLVEESFNPVTIVKEVVDLFSATATSKGLHIDLAFNNLSGNQYISDPARLREMLSNLLNNAVKFTSQGGIKVEVREIETDGSHSVIEFAVSDAGIGITAEDQQKLFLPFSQLDASPTRKFGGTGLGLSIVAALAKLMGGHVGVESSVGQGSRFWFTIRAAVASPGNAVRRDTPVSNPFSLGTVAVSGPVLVVEDMDTNRMVIKAMLKRLGVQCDVVTNGQEAVERLLSESVRYKLILMDVQMPVMDGLKATEKIRDWERLHAKPRTPIAALTAGAYAEDRENCRIAGMDDYLTKPIMVSELKMLIEKWLVTAGEKTGSQAGDRAASQTMPQNTN